MSQMRSEMKIGLCIGLTKSTKTAKWYPSWSRFMNRDAHRSESQLLSLCRRFSQCCLLSVNLILCFSLISLYFFLTFHPVAACWCLPTRSSALFKKSFSIFQWISAMQKLRTILLRLFLSQERPSDQECFSKIYPNYPSHGAQIVMS